MRDPFYPLLMDRKPNTALFFLHCEEIAKCASDVIRAVNNFRDEFAKPDWDEQALLDYMYSVYNAIQLQRAIFRNTREQDL